MAVIDQKDGYLVVKESGSGRLVQLPESEAMDLVSAGGGEAAQPEEIEAFNHAEEFGTTGQQALGLAETGVRAATFGLVDELAPGGLERQKELSLQSPGLQFGAEVAGSLAGGAGVGLGVKAGAKAVGLGAKAVARAGLGAAELGEAAADEVSEAYKADRRFMLQNFAVNAAASGLLGAVVNQVGKRAIAPGAAKLRRIVGEPAKEGGELTEDAALNAIAKEQREANAADAIDTEAGNTRTIKLARNYDEITSKGAKIVAESYSKAFDAATDVLDRSQSSARRKRVADLLPESTPELKNQQIQAFLDEGTEMGEFLAWGRSTGIDTRKSFRGEFERLRSVLDEYSNAISKQDSDVADWYLAANKAKQAKQGLHKKLADKRNAALYEPGTLETVKGKLDEIELAGRSRLTDEKLFGEAAKWEAATNDIWHRGLTMSPLAQRGILTHVGSLYNAVPGQGTRNMRLDPGKVEAILRQNDNQSQLMREALEQQAQFLEDAAKLNGKDGYKFLSESDAAKVIKGAKDLREQLDHAAAANAARHQVATSPEIQAKMAAEDKAARIAAEEAAGVKQPEEPGVAGAIAGAASAVGGFGGMGSVINMLTGGSQGRRAIHNAVGQGLGLIERAARQSVPGSVAYTAGVQSGIGRLWDGQETEQQAYEAKRDVLAAVMEDPYEATIAAVESVQSIGDADPEVFQTLMDQVFSSLNYIQSNAPAAIAASAEHPNGVPLSTSQLRQMATLYDTVLQPASVLVDMSARMATPQQMKVLRDVHPEFYQRIVDSAIEQVSSDPASVSPTSKAYFSTILGIGEAFGPLYTPGLNTVLQPKPGEETKQQNVVSSGSQGPSESAAPTAGGLKSIQSSVTNG